MCRARCTTTMWSSLASLTAAAALATRGIVLAQFYPASPTTSGIPVSVPSKAGVPLAAGGCDEARTYDPDREPARYHHYKSCYLAHSLCPIACAGSLAALALSRTATAPN
jgi:hypothetical protein